jgi:hypothetical protein
LKTDTIRSLNMHRGKVGDSIAAALLPAEMFFLGSAAADQRGACAGNPQCLRPVPKLLLCGWLLRAVISFVLLLQDANPSLEQILPRVVAQEQRRIKKEVPASSNVMQLLELQCVTFTYVTIETVGLQLQWVVYTCKGQCPCVQQPGGNLGVMCAAYR